MSSRIIGLVKNSRIELIVQTTDLLWTVPKSNFEIAPMRV